LKMNKKNKDRIKLIWQKLVGVWFAKCFHLDHI